MESDLNLLFTCNERVIVLAHLTGLFLYLFMKFWAGSLEDFSHQYKAFLLWVFFEPFMSFHFFILIYS